MSTFVGKNLRCYFDKLWDQTEEMQSMRMHIAPSSYIDHACPEQLFGHFNLWHAAPSKPSAHLHFPVMRLQLPLSEHSAGL